MRWKAQTGLGGKMKNEQPDTEKLDALTGILKKNVAEANIASIMSRKQGGALFLCDVDRLHRINDQHGHLAGDECLKQVAQILTYMTRQEDILGRRGGDEFLIYMPGCKDIHRAQETCERIENRFRVGSRGKEKDKIAFSVTVVCVMRNSGDNCRKLLERADAELEKRKAALYTANEQADNVKDHYIMDARRIRKELLEQIKIPGAYCQDYETFKGIYRFLERGLIRSGQKACVILMTVVNGQGESLLPYEKDALMERLGEDIRSTLRLGDVYTRYSSSQYLVLVIDTTEGQADMIADRIKGKFLAGSLGNDILIHRCYELQPAKIGEIIEWDDMEADLQRL